MLVSYRRNEGQQRSDTLIIYDSVDLWPEPETEIYPSHFYHNVDVTSQPPFLLHVNCK